MGSRVFLMLDGVLFSTEGVDGPVGLKTPDWEAITEPISLFLLAIISNKQTGFRGSKARTQVKALCSLQEISHLTSSF